MAYQHRSPRACLMAKLVYTSGRWHWSVTSSDSPVDPEVVIHGHGTEDDFIEAHAMIGLIMQRIAGGSIHQADYARLMK